MHRFNSNTYLEASDTTFRSLLSRWQIVTSENEFGCSRISDMWRNGWSIAHMSYLLPFELWGALQLLHQLPSFFFWKLVRGKKYFIKSTLFQLFDLFLCGISGFFIFTIIFSTPPTRQILPVWRRWTKPKLKKKQANSQFSFSLRVSHCESHLEGYYWEYFRPHIRQKGEDTPESVVKAFFAFPETPFLIERVKKKSKCLEWLESLPLHLLHLLFLLRKMLWNPRGRELFFKKTEI